LSDLTLVWLAGQIGHILALDLVYLASLLEPVAPWGCQRPHDPTSGIFTLADEIKRPLPTSTDNITHETIHPSVLFQSDILPEPQIDIVKHPDIIAELTPIEKQLKDKWPYHPENAIVQAYKAKASVQTKSPTLLAKVAEVGQTMGKKVLERTVKKEAMISQSGHPVYESTWLTKVTEETRLGPYVRAVMDNDIL